MSVQLIRWLMCMQMGSAVAQTVRSLCSQYDVILFDSSNRLTVDSPHCQVFTWLTCHGQLITDAIQLMVNSLQVRLTRKSTRHGVENEATRTVITSPDPTQHFTYTQWLP